MTSDATEKTTEQRKTNAGKSFVNRRKGQRKQVLGLGKGQL